MRFRLANGTHRRLVSKGEILEVNFKLILMRVEVRDWYLLALYVYGGVAYYAAPQTTLHGEKKLCYYDLHIETASFITLRYEECVISSKPRGKADGLCRRVEAELVHVINESSPFFGQSAEEVASSDFLLILMMSGIDETLHDMVHKQYEYDHDAIRWGYRFEPMVGWDEDHNCMTLDFDKLSKVVPVESEIDIKTVLNGDDRKRDQDGKAECADQSPTDLNILDDMDKPAELWQVRCENKESLTSAKGSIAYAGEDDERIEGFEQGLEPETERAHSDKGEGEADMRWPSKDSTRTNSGSEDGGRYNKTAVRVPFEHRLRAQSWRRNSSCMSSHSHGMPGGAKEAPMSLLRRRVRFKNHPLTRFANGLYYRALSTSWWLLLVGSVVFYYGVIALIAAAIHFSVRPSALQC